MITLLGEPKSTQSIYKYTCRGSFGSLYMTKDGKAIKEDYSWQAKRQWKKPMITGQVELKIDLFFGTKRKCDWDNFHKLSMDSLSGIIWEDDSQIQEASVRKHYCKNNPRIEINVNELGLL